MHCDRCGRDAVLFQRYSGMHLCSKHFKEDVERKIRRKIRKSKIGKGEKIALALSGGKDSSVAAYALKNVFRNWKDIDMIAITIDEGIEGYRDEMIEGAKSLTKKLHIDHRIESFEDNFDYTIDEIACMERELGICSFCGVLRRKLLNAVAREEGATRLATGHNLDDEAQTILMNLLRGDVERIARFVPSKVQPGLIPRLKPLSEIPENEVILYANLEKLPIPHKSCPYVHEAMRRDIRGMLNDLEERHPGTKYSLMGAFYKINESLKESYVQGELNRCERCGEPCIGNLCQSCKLLDLLGEPLQDKVPKNQKFLGYGNRRFPAT